jgi:hypothetical protein
MRLCQVALIWLIEMAAGKQAVLFDADCQERFACDRRKLEQFRSSKYWGHVSKILFWEF